MEIKITSRGNFKPAYETEYSSGADLRAYIDEPITLKLGERKIISTGISIELPCGYEAQVRARSGLAIKHGIGLVNGIGTIDADYRGELNVPLINFGNEDYIIENGDRIAQMVITRYEKASFKIVSELNETERGTGGFGHTGVK